MDFNGKLENGVELYTSLNPALRGFCLSLWVRRGSMHDEHHGLAHMLEHVTFRCISERMGGRLYETLARLGLDFDASTFTGYVRFEMSGPVERFREGLDILMMALDPPELSVAGLQMERLRVQAEIREGGSDETAAARVWRGTNLERTISGTVNSTNRIGFDMLRQEHARWFSRGNFFFCLTGGVTDISPLAERLSALRPDEVTEVIEACPVPEGFFHRGPDILREDSEYTGLRFCFDVDVTRHSEMVHMMLMDYLLGDLGTLYLALSEDAGLVYNLSDYFERFSNIGSLTFDFEVEPARLEEAVGVVADTLNAAKGLTEEKFAPAKAFFLAGDWLGRDYVCTFNNSWGYDNGLRHGGFRTPEDQHRAYVAVTASELAQASREIFRPENLVLLVQGSRRRFRPDRLGEILARLG